MAFGRSGKTPCSLRCRFPDSFKCPISTFHFIVIFSLLHCRNNIPTVKILSVINYSMSRPTNRFGLLKKEKAIPEEQRLETVKMPSSSMFRIMVNFVKDGPRASEIYKTSDSLLEEETDAPMPRRKSQYEIFLKHKVREAQIRSYNDEMERESRLSRSSSRLSGHSTDTILSVRHVRFADDV